MGEKYLNDFGDLFKALANGNSELFSNHNFDYIFDNDDLYGPKNPCDEMTLDDIKDSRYPTFESEENDDEDIEIINFE